MKEEDNWFDSEDDVTLVQRYESLLYQHKPIYFEIDEFESITYYYLFQNNYAEAMQVVRYAEICYPDSPEVKFIRAKVLLGSEKLDEVLVLLKELEAEEPEWSAVHILRGKVYLLQNRPEDAEVEFNTALRKDPEDIFDLSFVISDFFIESEEIDYAIKFLEQVIGQLPPNADMFFQLASCYERMGKDEQAEAYYEKSLDEAPFNVYTWLTLGLLRDRSGRYEQALEAFDFALTIDDDFEPTLFSKANTLIAMERYTDAIDLLNDLIKELPTNPYAMCLIAECYENMHRYEEATSYYKKVIENRPDFSDAFFGLGSTLAKQDDPENALLAIDRALELDPNNFDFLFTRGEILLQVGAKEEAMKIFQQIADESPDDADVWLMISYIKEEESLETAIELLLKAYEPCADNAKFNCRLAILYFRIKDIPKCVDYLQRAFALDEKSIDTFFSSCLDAQNNEEIMKIYGHKLT